MLKVLDFHALLCCSLTGNVCVNARALCDLAQFVDARVHARYEALERQGGACMEFHAVLQAR